MNTRRLGGKPVIGIVGGVGAGKSTAAGAGTSAFADGAASAWGVCAVERAARRSAIASAGPAALAGEADEPDSSADGTRIFAPHFLHVANWPADSSATRNLAPQCSQLNLSITDAFPHPRMDRLPLSPV